MAAGESTCREPGPHPHPSSRPQSRARAWHGRKTWMLESLGAETRGCKPLSDAVSLTGSLFFQGFGPQTFGRTFRKLLSHHKQPLLASGLVVHVKPTLHELHPSSLFLYTPFPAASSRSPSKCQRGCDGTEHPLSAHPDGK